MKKLTTIEFIERAIKIHGNKYDYSKVNYISAQTKIKIVCPEHGIFMQIPNSHLSNRGCSRCSEKHKPLKEEFIEKAKKIHGKKYDYSLVNYINNKVNIKIICPEHGVFEQTPNRHLAGCNCPVCKIRSKDEIIISNWLTENNIHYEIQKTFSGCKNVSLLKYDFYLPNEKILIECDGEQHYREVEYWGGKEGFNYRRMNDKIKTEFAINNNLNLLRIPYTERKNLSEVLKNNINIFK